MPASRDRMEYLVRALNHLDWQAREAACKALGKLGDPCAVEALIARLRDTSAEVRREACRALGRLRAARRAAPVVPRLNDPGAEDRQAACGELGKLSAARAAEALTARWMEDDDSNVRGAAREALRRLGSALAVEPLIARICQYSGRARAAAADALRSLGESRLASAVVGVWEGRKEAFEELAQLVVQGDARAIHPLVARVADPNAAVRRAVGQVLTRISIPLAALSAELLCRPCLARFEEKMAPEMVPWYACRICGKADNAFLSVRQVVVVQDEDWGEELSRDNGVLRVNWLRRRAAFDFDRVEVLRASDREAERLCIVVENDVDEYRRARYKTVPWVVAPQCPLSENTLRVLRSTFGPEGC